MAIALRRAVSWILAFVLSSLLMISFSSVPAQAQFDSTAGCKEVDISFSQLFNPGNYFPLVPAECGTIGNNNVAAALPLTAIPIILLRAYGAVSSMVIYLFGFFLVYSGILWISSGVNPAQKAKALTQIQTGLTAVVMILAAYTVVNTIAIVLRIDGVADQNVTDFFVQ